MAFRGGSAGADYEEGGFVTANGGSSSSTTGPQEQEAPKKLDHLSEGLIDKNWWETLSPYVAEFSGTFLLTLTYLCNTSAGDPIWAVTSNAVMVMVAMYMFGHVSGGNLNPCISLALWLARRHNFWTACQFCVTQILGGAGAALLFYQFAQVEVDLGPKKGYSAWEVVIVECLYTAMIVFVYLNCAASRGNNPLRAPNGFIGLAVGMCYVAGGYASMEISGTVMNPAVAIGLQIASTRDETRTSWGLEYLPMEIFGAFLAVSAYRLVRPNELDSTLMHEPNDGNWQPPLGARVMAEFIGTFYLVFTKALNNIGSSKAEAWSVAAALASMQYALRGVSGGHFNPAVSLSAALSSRRICTSRNALIYVGAQIFAGLAGSTMYGFVHHGGHIRVRPPQKTEFKDHYGAIIVGEVVFTCLISYAVLTTTAMEVLPSKRRSNDIAGLAVGMCIAVGGFAVGNVSGAVLNPAMAVGFTGLNVIGGDLFQSVVMGYILFHVLGAILAAGLFCITHVDFFKTTCPPAAVLGGALGAASRASPAGACD